MSSPSAIRSRSVARAARERSSSTASLRSGVVSKSTRGCSGAITAKVMPKLVSGRVVKMRTASGDPSSAACPATGRSNSAPSDRPIQFRCITFTRSGHSRSSSA